MKHNAIRNRASSDLGLMVYLGQCMLLAGLLPNCIIIKDFYFISARKPEVFCLNTKLNSTKCYSQIKYFNIYEILPSLI